ncbi:MAG: carboxymuconolactone decarboxylase family protein [Myxococcales bacterium]|nr:carboxymuconolactone decarboxylase family protein [Myxococcales bacterium]
MSKLAIPATVDATPAASQPLLAAVKNQLGSVPNLFRLLGTSPASLEGYLGLSGALGKGELDVKTRQRLAIRVAELNGCDYCLSAHTYLGQNLAKLDENELAAAREGRSADPKADAALRFATEVVRARGHVSAAALSAARAGGLSDAQVIEVVLHVAVNTLTNYVNTVAGTDVDFPRLSAHAAYDDLCAVAVSMGERVASDGVSSSRYADRLFRFSSAEAKAMFDADPGAFVSKADARWPLP